MYWLLCAFSSSRGVITLRWDQCYISESVLVKTRIHYVEYYYIFIHFTPKPFWYINYYSADHDTFGDVMFFFRKILKQSCFLILVNSVLAFSKAEGWGSGNSVSGASEALFARFMQGKGTSGFTQQDSSALWCAWWAPLSFNVKDGKALCSQASLPATLPSLKSVRREWHFDLLAFTAFYSN